MKILTPFVLGSVVSGGLIVFSCPLIFSALTSLRYPQPQRVRQTGGASEQGGRTESRLSPQRSMSAPRTPYWRHADRGNRGIHKKRQRVHGPHHPEPPHAARRARTAQAGARKGR